MTDLNWQLQTPLDAVIFDCDGTLSSIEGIDELAKNNHVEKKVSALTAEAMGKTGINPALYQQRLDLVKPTQEQVISLGMDYYTHRAPDAENVISLLQRLDKPVYIVSAGLSPPIYIFGQLLKIPESHIYAVRINFDDEGHFIDFDHHSPLVTREGKRLIVTELKTKHQELAYIGDGLNDCAVSNLVRRFIGYGGAYYRENIAALCNYYIKSPSLAPLLPLVLTQAEHQSLSASELTIYQKGLRAIQEKEVLIAGGDSDL